MSKIINPNQPEPSQIDKVLMAIGRQLHDITAAVIILQQDVKRLKDQVGLSDKNEVNDSKENGND